MPAQRMPVVGRHKDYDLLLSTAGDFILGSPEPFDTAGLATDPRLSLYCLDHESREAVFVETPDTVDLTTYPFFFLAQFHHATHVVTAPFPTLYELADTLRPRDPAPILIHSVGRCGSTLLSRTFAAVPDVCSLAEPDVFTQLTEWRGAGEIPAGELRRLTESCTHLLGKPMAGTPGRTRLAIKFRAQCIELADVFAEVLPGARQVYVTRAPLDWLESVWRAFVDPRRVDDASLAAPLEAAFGRAHPLIRSMGVPGHPMPVWKTWMLVWIANTETHRRHCADGLGFLELDYARLRAAPLETIDTLFAYCGLASAHRGAVADALARDSQAGSIVARSEINKAARRLPPEVRAAAEALLRSRGHRVQAG